MFEVATGKELGVLPNEQGIHPTMAVLGGRLFFSRTGFVPAPNTPPERALQCVDLATGELVWARPVSGTPIPVLR